LEETVMKRFLVYALSLILFAPLVSANATRRDSGKKNQYLPGTVVTVQKHEAESNYVGDNPSDAPLQSNAFAYDISLRVSCGTYIGRYQSASDYLPAVFTPNRPVEIRLQKHVMYVEVPGEREYKMGIVDQPRGSKVSCNNSQ
jgi:hypothetical protein